MEPNLLGRSVEAVLESMPTLSMLTLLAFALLSLEQHVTASLTEGRGAKLRAWWCWALVLGPLFFYQSFQHLWLCDDAYISFRYAAQFARGEGLVFNPGEWVEGYTNFLWTLLLGLLAKLSLPIPSTALLGNALAAITALFTVAWTERRLGAQLPLLALALCGSFPFLSFSSSGLETMPAIALTLLGLAAALRGHAGWSGIAMVGAGLCRPDHLIFWGSMGLTLAALSFSPRAGWRGLFSWMKIFRFAAPFLFIYLPYFLVRWRAYGDLFPNTYYAKSGGSSYWSQGGIYLWSFLVGSGGWLWLTALLPLGFLRLSQRGHQASSRSEINRTQGSAASTLKLYCAIAIPLFSL
ncbi:MAG: hypothetical protein VYD19_03290, partial [Myxococcota bacterium]|nr:hypothetical protein [Myxococcota bacterium]